MNFDSLFQLCDTGERPKWCGDGNFTLLQVKKVEELHMWPRIPKGAVTAGISTSTVPSPHGKNVMLLYVKLQKFNVYNVF